MAMMGSVESMELRAAEQAKISCAKKHFCVISGDAVRYDVVDSYEALRQLEPGQESGNDLLLRCRTMPCLPAGARML